MLRLTLVSKIVRLFAAEMYLQPRFNRIL
ncbi:MAG: hypothetical protein ACI90A_001372, partial [Shewanella sp.]